MVLTSCAVCSITALSPPQTRGALCRSLLEAFNTMLHDFLCNEYRLHINQISSLQTPGLLQDMPTSVGPDPLPLILSLGRESLSGWVTLDPVVITVLIKSLWCDNSRVLVLVLVRPASVDLILHRLGIGLPTGCCMPRSSPLRDACRPRPRRWRWWTSLMCLGAAAGGMRL